MPAPECGPDGRVLRETDGDPVTVNVSIAAKVEALFVAAGRDGMRLRVTSSFREPGIQEEIYRRNGCYADPSSCVGVVARPGSSNHERGLALDFDSCASTSTACWRWLNRNAARYGLYNRLPNDRLHWSTTGD